MKRILFPIIFLSTLLSFSQNIEIKPYVEYLNKIEKKSAKDYILEKFKTHDIVILCERHHDEFSQYELIKEIISDNSFKKNVKNLFTEAGLINQYPELTNFLKKKGLDSSFVHNKLVEFQRNSSFWFTSDHSNYHYLLKTIYNLNNNSESQINYISADVEFDWSKVKDSNDFYNEMEYETEPRDSIMAYNIINCLNKIKAPNSQKALVIMNYRHAFKIHTKSNNGTSQNVGKYLTDYYGDRVASILINQTYFKGNDNKLIQNGKWDAALKYLDIENIGFDFSNSIFGKDILDMWEINQPYTYRDAFDGFVFYNPLEVFYLASGVKGLVPKTFEKELIRRTRITLEYQKRIEFLKKLEDENFKKAFFKDLNTKRIKKYPDSDFIIKERDKYLND